MESNLLLSLVSFCFFSAVLSQTFNPYFPRRKTWWAKHITNDVFTAGRLTETQIKYAMEAGFMSIVSLWKETDSATIGEEILPTSEVEEHIVKNLAPPGRDFEFILENRNDWSKKSTIDSFSELYDSLEKPILLHCDDSYESSFVALLHFVDRSVSDPSLSPTRDMTWFYYKASGLGFDYYADDTLKDLVEDISNETHTEDKVTRPDLTVMDWYTKYWLVKPLYKNWYITGQIQKNHVSLIDTFEFQSFVNARKGVTILDTDTPSQEEAVLLNIKDRTGTYTGTGRQSTSQLEQNIIWDSVENEYISSTSSLIYQTMSDLQFGDDIGYNETIQRVTLEDEDYTYYHTPVGGKYTYGRSLWDAYKDVWAEVGNAGNAMMQCRTGYRSIILALMAAGRQYQKSSTWAIDKAHQLGYFFDEDDTVIVDLFQYVLDELPYDATTKDTNEPDMDSKSDSLKNTFLLTSFMIILVPILSYGYDTM